MNATTDWLATFQEVSRPHNAALIAAKRDLPVIDQVEAACLAVISACNSSNSVTGYNLGFTAGQESAAKMVLGLIGRGN